MNFMNLIMQNNKLKCRRKEMFYQLFPNNFDNWATTSTYQVHMFILEFYYVCIKRIYETYKYCNNNKRIHKNTFL